MGARSSGKKKSIKMSGSSIIAFGAIAAICFCVLFVIIRATGAGAYTETEDAKNGAQYLSSIEGRDVKSIANRISQAKAAQKEQYNRDSLSSMDEEGTDIWPLFKDMVIIGDSRVDAYVEYGFLPDSIIVANLGANLKYADQLIPEVTAKQPGTLIFTYGINDVDGNWKSAEAFTERYKEILGMYKEELPNAEVFICSLIPVKDIAIEEDPNYEAVPEYAEAVRKMCEEEGLNFIDCDSLYEYDEYYEGDGIHFKPDMYPIWGEIILRKVLGNGSSSSSADSDQNN